MSDRHAHIGTRRRWVKLWTQETLHGTTFHELQPDERAVWFGFLCLAGDSPCPGTICVAVGIPYSPQQLAAILQVSPELLARATKAMAKAHKIGLNGEGIHILNWAHYQDDYARVQKHREAKMRETPQDETPPPDQTRTDQIRSERS